VIPQTPYSPDLAPSDIRLFPKNEDVKKSKFLSYAEFEATLNKWTSSQPETFFIDGMNKWIEGLIKCVAVKCDCVEK
jgi:hypothetical protein